MKAGFSHSRGVAGALLGALLLCLAQFATALAGETLSLSDISIRAERGGERVEIRLSRSAGYRMFFLDGPPRLVIDLPPFQWDAPRDALARHEGSLILNIRFARFDADTSRLVFDLAAPAAARERRMTVDSRLVFLLLPQEGGDGGKEFVVSRSGYPVPVLKPAGAANPHNRPLVMIDPGHGGDDPGTAGKGGALEKRVTLEYAKALRDALLATGRYRVRLTREDDRFIRLRDRIRIAREAGAKLFISLHADSAPTRQARGLSVYTLSEDASDAEAAALAARENKADIIAGIDLSHEREDVMDILIDLAQRETKNKSIRLAEAMVAELSRTVRLLPNTHRFAGFAVLKAPDVPSALVEIGFLSHPEEEKQIRQAAHKASVTRGLVNAIDRYFEVQGRE